MSCQQQVPERARGGDERRRCTIAKLKCRQIRMMGQCAGIHTHESKKKGASKGRQMRGRTKSRREGKQENLKGGQEEKKREEEEEKRR